MFNQTIKDFELIIIDDGSEDNTEDVVSHFDDYRIQYYSQQNKGSNAARNRAITESSNKYIAFLDSDDEFREDHLSITLQTLSQSEGECVGGLYF